MQKCVNIINAQCKCNVLCAQAIERNTKSFAFVSFSGKHKMKTLKKTKKTDPMLPKWVAVTNGTIQLTILTADDLFTWEKLNIDVLMHRKILSRLYDLSTCTKHEQHFELQ